MSENPATRCSLTGKSNYPYLMDLFSLISSLLTAKIDVRTWVDRGYFRIHSPTTMSSSPKQTNTMSTNLVGRVKNTRLPLTKGLLPLFEAVLNSIHAIEEAGISTDDGRIGITILRKPKQKSLSFDDSKHKGPDALEDIVGFRIEDNGIGFTEDNMESFRTLDSDYKISKGGRGVGRLLWLKAFGVVKIESVFKDAETRFKRRRFQFDAGSGVFNEHIKDISTETNTGSVVELDGFDARYLRYSRKTGKAISEAILEHCLWYFLRPGSVPVIKIEDDGEVLLLEDSFEEHMHSSAFNETIKIKDRDFDLIHVKLRSNSLSSHTIAFCADQRLVCEEKLLGKITGLHGRISDGNGDFIYSCFVSSRFLDKCAHPERTDFDIMETVEGLFKNTEISLTDIRDAIVERTKEYLKQYIDENKARSNQRVSRFIAKRAPRYRPIISRIPEEHLNVDPEISDKELDLTLHKHFSELESELLKEGHDIMAASPGDDFTDYEARLQDYLSKAEDIKKSDLASYVSHRRVILDLFEKATKRDDDGKYIHEKLIHQLIMPMRVDSNTAPLNAGNLWLVDERLAFHDYLASDLDIDTFPITDTEDKKRPDICTLNVYDQPILFSEATKMPPASLEIIEIKRPLRNDAASGKEHDPIEQAIGYLERIRKGGVKTAEGRPIPESTATPGFCYILADLTPKLKERCKMHDLTLTADGMGYFGYKRNSRAYIEVIGFDRLLNMAKERNRAFFDKLGLPAN